MFFLPTFSSFDKKKSTCIAKKGPSCHLQFMVQNDPECSNFFHLLPKKSGAPNSFWRSFGPTSSGHWDHFSASSTFLRVLTFKYLPTEWDGDVCRNKSVVGEPISVKHISKYCPFFWIPGIPRTTSITNRKPPTIHRVRMCSWNSNERGGLLLLDFRSCDHWPRAGYNLEAFTNFGLPRSSNQEIPRSSVSPLTSIFGGFLSFFVQRYLENSVMF